MQAEDLHAVTGLVNCAFLFVGGQWFGKTSLRMTSAYFLAAKTPVHEDGGHDHDAPLAHVVLCSSGFNSFSGIFRSWTVYKMGNHLHGAIKRKQERSSEEVPIQNSP